MRVGGQWMWSVALLLILAGVAASAMAAERRGERGTPPVDAGASRKVTVAREFIAARQWAGAIDLIGELSGVDGDLLVRLDGDRAVPGRVAARVLLGAMPPEGLDQYRRRVDPVAKARFEAASAEWDEAALTAIVEEQFGSSVTDDALWLLGEIAFERGDLAQARSRWSLLVPLESRRTALQDRPARRGDDPLAAKPGDGEEARRDAPPVPEGQAEPAVVEAEKAAVDVGPGFVLAPDVQYPVADVRARLILCSIHLGEWSRTRRELNAFRELHPKSTGRLASRTGDWSTLLEEELTAAREREAATARSKRPAPEPANADPIQEPAVDPLSTATFAGTAERRGEGPPPPDFGGVAWSFPWARGYALDAGVGPHAVSGIPLSPWHVSVVDGLVFTCDEKSIFGWKLGSGEPIWAPVRSPVLFSLVGDGQGVTTHQYPTVGSPSFTVTVAGGRLYARLGSITMGRPTHPVPASSIVCLNVGAGQGRVEWVVEARDLNLEPGDWVFEGTPVISGDRAVVAVRLSGSKPRAGLVCLSATTGERIWFREVATAGPSWKNDEASRLIEVSHELVAVSEGTVVCNTHLGVIAAVDLETGDWRWAWSYPRLIASTPGESSNRRRFGPSPPVVVHGRVVVAPGDSSDLYCLDMESGMPLWRYAAGSRFRTVLGADRDRVYVAGRDLAALDADSGGLRWQVRSPDEDQEPAFCRGCLAGTELLWPTRDGLRVIKGETGEVTRVMRFRDKGIEDGGNIAVADGMTLVAGPKQLSVIRQEPVVIEKPPGVSRRVHERVPGRPVVVPVVFRPGEGRGPGEVLSSGRGRAPTDSTNLSRTVLAGLSEGTAQNADQNVVVTPPTESGRGQRLLRKAWQIERNDDVRFRLVPRFGITGGKRPPEKWALMVLGDKVGCVDPLTGATDWEQMPLGKAEDVRPDGGDWLIVTARETMRVNSVTGQIREYLRGNDPRPNDRTGGTPAIDGPGMRARVWPGRASGVFLEEWRYPFRLRERTGQSGPGATSREWVFATLEEITSVTGLGSDVWGVITAEHQAWLLTGDSPYPREYLGPLSTARGKPVWVGGASEPKMAVLLTNGGTLSGVNCVHGGQAWSLSASATQDLSPDQLAVVGGLLSSSFPVPPAKMGEAVSRISLKQRAVAGPAGGPAAESAKATSREAVVLAVTGGVLSGWQLSTGQLLFQRVIGSAGSDWRFVERRPVDPVATGGAVTDVVLRRRDGVTAQFWRIDAATGRPLQWIETPYSPGRIEWEAFPGGVVLTGPRHATGFVYE